MYSRIVFLLLLVTLVGCGSTPMLIAPQQNIVAPSTEEAQVVFLRSSFVGSAISASLYEVTDGEIKFLGIIDNGKKIAYTTEPGKHVFMVVSEAADFLEAELSPGKRYYSIATPRMGAWKARFSLWPIKNDPDADYHQAMPKFDNWLNDTQLVEISAEAKAWYENNKASVKSKYESYWPVWQNKTEEELSRRTLAPEDGN